MSLNFLVGHLKYLKHCSIKVNIKSIQFMIAFYYLVLYRLCIAIMLWVFSLAEENYRKYLSILCCVFNVNF